MQDSVLTGQERKIRLFTTCTHAHFRIKDLFADTDIFRCYFHKLIIFNKIQSLFKT